MSKFNHLYNADKIIFNDKCIRYGGGGVMYWSLWSFALAQKSINVSSMRILMMSYLSLMLWLWSMWLNLEKINVMDSRWGTVGRIVTSHTRGSEFKSAIFVEQVYAVNCWKHENKEKVALGQLLWLSWQRSGVRIQSLANFYRTFVYCQLCWKSPEMAQMKQLGCVKTKELHTWCTYLQGSCHFLQSNLTPKTWRRHRLGLNCLA